MGVYGTTYKSAFSGLGKPSIKLEFEDNDQLLAFQRRIDAGDGDDGGDTPDGGGNFTPGDRAIDALSRLATGRPYLKATRGGNNPDGGEPVAWSEQEEMFVPVEGVNLGKLPPMKGDRGNAFAIDWTPLQDIYTDEKNFQNRQDKFSEKSVKAIINAVKSGSFNWFAFDPVTLWENPKDGRLYVLSGHSRTEAFRQLSRMKPQPIVDGLTFNYIPAKIFKGSFEDAKNLALNSNALSSPETLTERAEYYREQRAALKKSDWKKLKEKALRESSGQLIWDLSFLPANGTALSALKSFKIEGQDSTENFLRLATICQWIGKAFQIYKNLGRWHDQELFKFLMDGGYGSRSGQYFAFSALNERLQKLYEKNVRNEKKISKNGEYTEPFQIAAYKKSDDDLNELDALKKESSKAERELKGKLKDLRFSDAGREDVFRVATPYYNNWVNAQFDWWQSLDRTPKKDDKQQALFGTRHASDALYNNNELMECRGLKPTYRQLDNYDVFFNVKAVKNSQDFAGFGLDDTKKLIADICKAHYKDCARIAQHLKGDTKLQSVFNLWHWLRHNIRYEYDREGREEVRTPLRTWADRQRGVDCDCLSVFAWCVLKCMGYDPAFELVCFKGKKQPSHILVNLDGIRCDRVWFVFNALPPGVTNSEIYRLTDRATAAQLAGLFN